MFKRSTITLVTLLALGIAAHAQQQPSQLELNFHITAPETDLILRGLGAQPFNDVAPLINKLRTQYIEQQQSKAAVEPPKQPKEEK